MVTLFVRLSGLLRTRRIFPNVYGYAFSEMQITVRKLDTSFTQKLRNNVCCAMAAKSTIAAAAKVISKPRRFTPRRAALTLVGFKLDHNDIMTFFVCLRLLNLTRQVVYQTVE